MDINPQDICDAGLSLRLGIGPTSTADHHPLRESCSPCANMISDKPSFTLSLTDDVYGGFVVQKAESNKARPAPLSSPHSAVSSFSCFKKEKDEEVEAERVSSRGSDEEDNGSSRKKLRLTKEQSAMLEDRFKEHSTLNPKQKQALAKQLNLQPRQVEVWFQNRRARTKLKQTEVDREFLRRCYETLTNENQRLQRELQELKALKLAPPPLYMQLPAATLTMCPSCERINGGGADERSKVGSSGPVVVAPIKPGHFCNPFTHSAAC